MLWNRSQRLASADEVNDGRSEAERHTSRVEDLLNELRGEGRSRARDDKDLRGSQECLEGVGISQQGLRTCPVWFLFAFLEGLAKASHTLL